MANHPLASALATTASVGDHLAVCLDPASGGERFSDLAADPARLAELAEASASELGTDETFVGATILFERLALQTAMALIAPCLSHRRVPLAGPATIQRITPADAPEPVLALTDPGFACLPKDPASGHPDARVLANADTLRETLRERLTMTLAPLVEAFAYPARRGRRTQWRCVTDKAVTAAWGTAAELGDPDAGIALAAALFDDASEFPGGTNFWQYERDGVTRTHRIRGTCCQKYRVAGKPYCFTCPLMKSGHRRERWQADGDLRRRDSCGG